MRKTSGCRSRAGQSSEMKTAMPSAIGRRDQQREHRRVERAPDERQRAELAGDRIPDRRCARSSKPNFWIDSIDCRVSSTPIAHDDERRATSAKTPVADPEPEISPHRRSTCRRMLDAYDVLIFASAASSSLTTAAGSGA